MSGVPVDDAVLWRALGATVRDVVIPALPPGHALDTAVPLTGLARYAASRPAPAPAGRARQLQQALGTVPHAAPDLDAVLPEASRVLVAAVAEPDAGGPASRVRAA